MGSQEMQSRNQSLGNIVLLEHLNLTLRDIETTLNFFIKALGLTLDPFRYDLPLPITNNALWINCGYQQFHLPTTKTAEIFGGHVGIVVPDLEKVKNYLTIAEPLLTNTKFCWSSDFESHTYFPVPKPAIQNGTSKHVPTKVEVLSVTEPNGNKLKIYENNHIYDFRGGLGFAYIEVKCPIGSASAIARWYRYYFKTPTFESNRSGNQIQCDTVTVPVGINQSLIFHESEDFTYDGGYHICFYITDFEDAYGRFERDGLLYNEHKFNDHARTLEEALHYNQFRVKDIVELPEEDQLDNNNNVQDEPKRIIMRFEHEVRSLHHPQYMRPLVNRMGNFGQNPF